MKVIVSDTSVIIDLCKVRLIEPAFSLPYEFVVPDVMFEDELLDLSNYEPGDLLASGLAVSDLSGEAVGMAVEYGAIFKRLSTNDQFALAMFNSGEGGFRDRDLYPYCVGPDGKFSAHPTLAGTDATRLIDKAGNPIGQKVMTVAKQGEVSEVEYVWNRPGEDRPTTKIAFATKIGDQTCAVGYYK